MKTKNPVKKLSAEAERFRQLAKDEALNAVLKDADPVAFEKCSRKAQDHLIRAETYKTAAALIQ